MKISLPRRIRSAALAATALAIGIVSDPALAEASHHQGASAGQVGAATNSAQLESLTTSSQGEWRFTVFPSYLRATSAFDDGGMALSMPAGTRVENYTLNAFAERRLGERWAVSALTGWQELRLSEGGVDRTVSSLTDSFLAVRHSDRASWGTLSAVATVKLPGTYPESSLTAAKQVDTQVELLASIRPLEWLSIVAGGGYRLRFGGVDDELIATVLLPIGLGERLTVTPTLLAATPVGFGEVAKNAVSAGASLGWCVYHGIDVLAPTTGQCTGGMSFKRTS